MDIEFEMNQQRDRAKLAEMNSHRDFDTLQRIGDLGESIATHHFHKDSVPRFYREIEALGVEDALDNFICRVAALEHSEVSETVEEGRLPNRSFALLMEEQTDVLIRTLNAMTTLLMVGKERGDIRPNVQIGDFIASKMAKNIERPVAHGGKRF